MSYRDRINNISVSETKKVGDFYLEAFDIAAEADAEIAELKHERDLANKRFDEKCNEFMFTGLAQEKEISDMKADLLRVIEIAEQGAKLVSCRKCGATKLEVGSGDWFGVLRCPTCKHEEVLFDG